ncbi:uncharacterized protein LOC129301507 [Prosopis cineraria]|uniref:uncharacterized protein LOC129301507 n=1 Tax=Prosopis cineraria TaxID=364024 RepID=UPI00240FB892|nr:uncharacterized protein LOC129301507 [Prosopis cineraria]
MADALLSAVFNVLLERLTPLQADLINSIYWLDELKDAAYDLEDLMDEISTRAATQKKVHYLSFASLGLRDTSLANKLEAISDRIEHIVALKDGLHLKETSGKETLLWRSPVTSHVNVSDVYGREKEKQDIIKLMFNNDDGGQLDSTVNSYLEEIRSDVASKCKGLPLAAKVLGGLFRSKPDFEDWNKILKDAMWDSSDSNEIIPALKFRKEELILMWMAEGFLQLPKGNMTLEEVGYRQLPALKTLYIEGLETIEKIGEESLKASECAPMIPFPSLECLNFNRMASWKEWHSIGMEAFPKLRYLDGILSIAGFFYSEVS